MEHARPLIHGLLAEFDSEEAVLAAAGRVREAGYVRTEAYSPMAVHGLSEALGQPPATMPAFTFWSGVFGAILGFGMCWYANVISYPWNVAGRPPNSWPAWIPITFEVLLPTSSLRAP